MISSAPMPSFDDCPLLLWRLGEVRAVPLVHVQIPNPIKINAANPPTIPATSMPRRFLFLVCVVLAPVVVVAVDVAIDVAVVVAVVVAVDVAVSGAVACVEETDGVMGVAIDDDDASGSGSSDVTVVVIVVVWVVAVAWQMSAGLRKLTRDGQSGWYRGVLAGRDGKELTV